MTNFRTPDLLGNGLLLEVIYVSLITDKGSAGVKRSCDDDVISGSDQARRPFDQTTFEKQAGKGHKSEGNRKFLDVMSRY